MSAARDEDRRLAAPWLSWCRRTLVSLRPRPAPPAPEPRRLPWYGQVDLPTTHR
jgi:hypothetical protein